MIPLFLVLSVITIVSGVIGGMYWWRQRSGYLAATHYNTGVSYLQTGKYPDAINEFTAALKRKKDLVDAQYGLGLTYVHQHRYQEGITMLESAVKAMPSNAIAHYNLGRAYITVGQLDEAQQVLKQALKVNPEVKEVHFNLARVYQEKGDLEQAKISCKHALKLDPNYGRAQDYLEFLSSIRHANPVNLEALRRALQDFDATDTSYMLTL